MPHPLLISLSLVLGPLAGSTAEPVWANETPTWKQIAFSDGITVYKREIEGSPIVTFRGTAVIDAPIAKVIGIILDTARAPEWAEDLEESKVLRWIKEPTEYIEYNHVATPVIMKDRDFVSLVRVIPDITAGTLTVRYEAAAPNELAPGKYVRGDLTGSGFFLKSLEGGTQTFLDGEIHGDPKGAIPKWLVNWFQESWPQDTIQAIRVQAKKSDVREHPYFKSLFADKRTQAATKAKATAVKPSESPTQSP